MPDIKYSKSGIRLKKRDHNSPPIMPGSSLEHLQAIGNIPYGYEIDDKYYPRPEPEPDMPPIDWMECPNCGENDFREVGHNSCKFECRNCDYYEEY